MIVHCKNTMGDGTVIYVDYEADDLIPVDPESEDATAEDYEAALREVGVDV